MKQRTFEQKHEAEWQQLEHWFSVVQARQNTDKHALKQFASLYRQVCHHLALAQARHYTPSLIERLNQLVLRGHQIFYTRRLRIGYQLGHFLISTFPQTVRSEWRLVWLSALLFFGTGLSMFLAVQWYPSLSHSVIPADQILQIELMYDPANKVLGEARKSDSDFMMFGYYIYNNISIGFRTYASGLLFGLGTLFFILFNGIFLGTVAGHLTAIGYRETFFSFVAGHSAPELIAIVLAGAGGLKLGLALIAPGRYARWHAVRRSAQASLPLVYGVFILLMVAAFIEAFWSSTATIAPLIKYSVGIGLWILLISYFLLSGRHRAT